ncbi:MAG: hypothetical protein CMJ45_14620 [Planctomyces sp.]|nr:hypothetical protein [Planctomyces sp.]
MLARTSFSVMYQKLNPTMQGKFLTKTNAMINEIGFDKSLLLFPESKNPFTIDQWLTTIENPGNINLPDKKGAYDKTVTSDLMTAPNAFVDNSPTDVSMGLFNTNDPFNDLIVIELRTLKHFAEVGTFTTKTMRELAKDLQIIYTASTL